jgi:phage/plasmid-associated DNA primase
VVPFERTFEPGEQVPREDLDARLSDPRELSGVLNRALDVLPRVRREGFTESESMRAAWEEFKAMTDPVSVWLAQHTIEGAEAYVPQSTLLGAFNRDCEKQGRAGMTAKAFTTAIRRARPGLDLKQRTVSGKVVWCWIGVGLRQGDGPPDNPPDSHGSRHSRHSTNCFENEETPQKQDRDREGKPEETNKGNVVKLVKPVNGVSPVQEQRIRELTNQGMREDIAREQVLGKGWVSE